MGLIALIALAALEAILGQPITQVTFEGSGCLQTSTTKIDVRGAEGIVLFENFQAGSVAQQKDCQIFVSLDLTDRCFNGAAVENSVHNLLPPNYRGTLTIRSFINDVEIQSPLVISITGQNQSSNQVLEGIIAPSKRYCGQRVTLRLSNTLQVLDPVTEGSVVLLNQKLNLNSPPRSQSLDRAPINLPVAFSGQGCSISTGTSVTQENWKVLIGYRYFITQGSQSSDCQVSIPLNLFGGCLVSMMTSTTISNRQAVNMNMRFLANGQRINWQNERPIGFSNFDVVTEYQNPYPAVCGENLVLNAYVTLYPYSYNASVNGAITGQSFEIRAVNSPTYFSGQKRTEPLVWLLALSLLSLVCR